MPLSGKEREIVQDVVSRFLNLNEPSSRKDLVIKSKSREMVNELSRWYLRALGDAYLPTCLAINESADPEGLRFAKQSVEIVLRALQNLYELEPTNRNFTFQELTANVWTRHLGGGLVSPGGIVTGLSLASEFGVLGQFSMDVRGKINSFTIGESILEITDFPGEWDRQVARAKTASAPPLATARKAVPGLPELPGRDVLLEDVSRSLCGDSLISVAFIDLDDFKAVNDTYGHQAGDECLEAAVKLIGGVLLNKGKLYRYGGDEFVAVLPNFGCFEATATAERIRRAIDEGNPGGRAKVTASIGVASSEHMESREARALIHLADGAMYDSKNTGKNRVTAQTPGDPALRAWQGVEWQGAFLAIESPNVLRLKKIEDQSYQESMVRALEPAGFKCYRAGIENLSPVLAQGYKIVWVTDRKSYRARITQFDVVLVARPQ
jgi:diguanylate cyclase (GGDEF)-like protein